ncbi:DNA translocase FtsK 4TM domain-containing protein [Rubrivirga sp. S365]|uniref:FtsK/SpoIIIE family DNA translocase n=1 Tax=Rubrivirga sp. S365 TaxID=3076080 RepID=UPI0028C67366|nr:DNA translocase FtsK 4TM domain-containing protein [Rubrivirga sp. S365]MDT7856972.1 DNA translocase FtsK 4TM domain-containing protein [Rubrivirga sp. S365]
MSSTRSSARSKKGRSKSKTSAGGFSRQRKQEVLGIILMALAVLVSLAVVTHAPADDALLAGAERDALFDPGDNRVDNLLGPVGALIAKALVAEFLGFPTLLVVACLFAWGWLLLRQKTPVFLPLLTGLAFAGALFLACFFGWLDGLIDADLARWSGALGLGVAGWLVSLGGVVGAGIVLAVAVVVTVLLVWDRDIQTSLDRAEGAVTSLGGAVTERWATYRTGATERKVLREKARNEATAERDARRAEKEKQKAAKQTEKASAPPAKKAAPQKAPDEAPAPLPASPPPVEAAPPRPEPPRPEPSEPLPAAPPAVGDGLPDDPVLDEIVAAERAAPAFHVTAPVEEAAVDLDAVRAPVPDEADLPYQMPSVELLEQSEGDPEVDLDEIEENKQLLLDKLETYNIQIDAIEAVVGPTVTRYELTPAAGVKISRITALEDDLAMALAAPGIRIIAPIPGKSSIGVEIPNRTREMVRLRQLLTRKEFVDAARGGKMALPVPIGKTIEGKVFVEDLAKMPHLLVAGATGSGKSVGVNALIVGLLYAKRPADLKFVMVDPKKIELNGYAELLRHFSAMPEDAEDPIITDFAQAAAALRSCEREMEIRYDLLAEAGVRGIEEYNKKHAAGKLADLGPKHKRLPYVVVVVDELADLMMTSAKEVEAPIARLAQMARAVGIHLVLATQRPSVDVITGLIKANFPSRMAYQTSSKIDSRTIIDGGGAQQLVGNGDLLYMNGSRLTRLQGPFVSVDEVEAVSGFISGQEGAGPYLLPPMDPAGDAPDGAAGNISDDVDDLFEDAAKVIVRSQQGSVSLLQRKLSVGYTRAARLVDQLEDAGIVGPFEGSKAREVLVPDEFHLDALLSGEPAEVAAEGEVAE